MILASQPRQRYDKAFRDWLRAVRRAGLSRPRGTSCLGAQTVRVERPSSARPLCRIAFERRRTDITEAFTRVAATVHTQTGVDLSAGNPDLALEHPSDEFPIGLVSFGGSPIWSADPPEMYVDIAEAVQSYLADRYRKVWPLCPRHHLGTHPRVAAGRSVWWCNGGAHESEPI